MWNGYLHAEKDAGISDSVDGSTFKAFEKWLWERYSFADGKSWGRLFEFLSLGVNEKALEDFYGHLELFLSGGSAKDHTKRFQQFLDEAVASALKEQNRIRGR